jgi:hypothetical protein
MPRGRYDDEVLRARALELRAKGLSYREGQYSFRYIAC